MPELPEVEITARRLSTALDGAEIESALAPGVATLKTFEPSLESLTGGKIEGVRRIGKMLAVDVSTADGAGPLTLLIHLMSAGRLQLFDKRASLRDKRSRILLWIDDGRELRLREFGTQQRAWGKLLATDAVDEDDAVATLGPEAWPPPPLEQFAELIDQPRHLHPLLRDQRTIAGIGRSWVDEILWEAELSPFTQGNHLDEEQLARLHAAIDDVLGRTLAHYEEVVGDSLPDKAPMPLKVHKRQGEPCPRCGETLAAVFFKDHLTTYCPKEQTGGRVLKDRRLSRLLK